MSESLDAAALRTDVFEKFVMRYREKYQGLDPADAMDFYKHVLHIDTAEFAAVVKLLFDSELYPFSFIQVLERHDTLHHSDKSQAALDRTWKLDSEKNSTVEMRRKQAQILANIPNMVANNPDGWRDDYFNILIDLHGEVECMRIATGIDGQFPEFKEWIYNRKKATIWN